MVKSLVVVATLQFSLPWATVQLPPVPGKEARESEPRPRLFVAQRSLDLGEILEGDEAIVRWTLENHGDADLVIKRTRSGCGCTVVRLKEEDKVIPPGGSLELKAVFNSKGRHGRQTKRVTVHSNDPSEPVLNLEFVVQLKPLYSIQPSRIVNLRAIRRGEPISQTIDIMPAAGFKVAELLDLRVADDSVLDFEEGRIVMQDRTGARVRMKVGKQAPLGPITMNATLKFSVDGIVREQVVPIRGQVVGDLTWTPKIVDGTRQAVRRGHRLAPVTVEATNKVVFKVLEAVAEGPFLDVSVQPGIGAPKGTKYSVFLTTREDAPFGPFGTMLEVRTNLPDQPVVRIPVFGIIAEPVKVDPPVILLRQDGTPAGTHRRVKLQGFPQIKLDLSEPTCDHEAVVATIDRESSARYKHLRYLDVRLEGKAAPGTHKAVLTVTTSVKGAERLEIPVIIVVPGGTG